MTLWIYLVTLPLIQFLGITACERAPEESVVFQKVDYTFPYNIDAPDTTIMLPPILEEISGLGYVPETKQLVSLQDETGTLFYLNTKNGKIEREVAFWGDGDFEGVEWVNEVVYAVTSKGDVYEIHIHKQDSTEVKTHKTFLNKSANVEGLGYYPAQNSLLLSCKGLLEGQPDTIKSIYTFRLDSMQLDSTPLFQISLGMVQDYLEDGSVLRNAEKVMDKLNPEEGGFTFGPSGIAQHPHTGNFYILSSVGKLLLVLSEKGEVLLLKKLSKGVLPQPEGIAFEPDGTMWISSEGKKGNEGKILKYSLQYNRIR
jgi:uncharacterized protein YjiK